MSDEIAKLNIPPKKSADELERLIIRLLTDFISLSTDAIDAKIAESLKLVGEFEGVDRSFVFTFSETDNNIFSCIYEWCKPGEKSYISACQNMLLSDYPSLKETFDKLDVYYIPDIDLVGKEKLKEKQTLIELSVISLILVPIIYQNSLRGFVGFLTSRKPRYWEDSSINLLKIFAEMLANALQRQKAENLIEEQKKQTEQLLDALPGIVFKAIRDDRYSIKFLSRGCTKITGYNPEELTGTGDRDYNSIIHHEDLPKVIQTIKDNLETHIYYEVEYRIYTKDGKSKWMWEKGVIRENNQQEIEGFITDITELKQTDKALRDSEERYRLLAENVTDMLSRHDRRGECLYASSASLSILGYSSSELPKDFLFSLCHPEDRRVVEGMFVTSEREPSVYRLRHRDGNYIWLETTTKTIIDRENDREEIIAVSRDISRRKETEELLVRAEEQYRDIFENTSEGIFQTSADGHYLKANPSLARIYGYDSPEELIEHLTDIKRQLYVDTERRVLFQQLLEQQGGKLDNFESQVYRKDGSIIWISENTRSVYDKKGNFLYYEGTVEDITYRLRTEAKLLHDAFYDSLTGLHNRAWFMNELHAAIEKHQKNDRSRYAVLFIDLDGFKIINDSYGHSLGDELLQKVAQRLKKEMREQDKIARLGGDEFAILIEDINHTGAAISIAQRVQEKLQIAFQVCQEKVFISASIGITTSDNPYEKAEEPLRDADIAMYRAKNKGKACYAIFDPEMQRAIVNRLQLENDLRQALDNQEFHLEYQPIISLSTGALTGFEALLRWHHPTRGRICPGEFIPVAEETGLIHPIGWWVLQSACYQLQHWKSLDPGAANLSINVNLSAHQLKETGIVKHIDYLLRKTGLEGRQLKLEITESAFLETITAKNSIVQQLKSFGLQLCIDDFGTGYSSLSRLHEFPIDTLKIDRSFIARLDSESSIIVQTILNLAHTLGMNVVAEGVETITQVSKLRELGCEFGQGYLISRPVDRTTACQWIIEPSYLKSTIERLKM